MLIVNYGPDPIRVRTVFYSPADVVQGKPAQVVEDAVVPIGGSLDFWVHFNFQVLVGEQPETSQVRNELVQGIADRTGLPVEVIERHMRRPTSTELRRHAVQILGAAGRDDDQNKSE